MDINTLALFKMARTKMDFVAQRQKVLAENIANADTPGYRAKDLREPDFKRMALDAMDTSPKPAVTHPNHIQASLPDRGPFREIEERRTFETSLDGNKVVLEEQVEQVSRGNSQYTTALNLIRKNMQMLKTALGRSGG
jgi:flagellar basal-body rod protein FlgB